jgi:hypothetical protein
LLGAGAYSPVATKSASTRFALTHENDRPDRQPDLARDDARERIAEVAGRNEEPRRLAMRGATHARLAAA